MEFFRPTGQKVLLKMGKWGVNARDEKKQFLTHVAHSRDQFYWFFIGKSEKEFTNIDQIRSEFLTHLALYILLFE